MTHEPDDSRIEVLLKDDGDRGRSPYQGPFERRSGGGPGQPRPFQSPNTRGRWVAAAVVGVLFLVMVNVFLQSFEPRVEWVDSAGRTMLEERPVFWPLVLFATLGRLLCGLVAWYPSFSDPTVGLFKVPDGPPLKRRRRLFRGLYFSGLALALVTLFNNLAFSDILGILRAVGLAVLILLGVTLLFRLAFASFLSRLSVNIQRGR